MLRRALPLLLSTCALVVLSAAPAQAKSCSLTAAEKGGSKPSTLGATYVTSLSAKGTSCGKAKTIVKGYNDCRGSGRKCGRKVSGFKCRTNVVATSPGQFIASVTCKKGGSKVKFDYTQFT